ncbi:MAG TPA: NAD(+)/NADH kinase [Lachnospiraceae bacterium]|jgi:NAD+ kinase|nr:NAD(+)/NADH kinase [Lachnospiraceae bacterium]
MKKFYVEANSDKDVGLKLSHQIKDYLVQHGCDCTVMGEMPSDTECVIVLGGDGTMIQAARDMARADIAFIGVNLGTLGYLAEIEPDAVFPMLDRLMTDEYEEEDRMMLCGLPTVKGVPSVNEFALNDVIVTRSGPMRLVTFIIYVNGKLLKTYGADGIIVSTPTGSTGYNLSTGGPIIEPSAKVLLLTPINAHTLNARSIILSSEDEITIEIGPSRRGVTETAEVFFDGAAMVKLESGDSVHIKKAEEITRILKMSKENFLDVLRRKLADAE